MVSIATGLTQMGRAQAEALMESTCVITRDTGASTTNATTGVVTPTLSTIYTGKCRLRVAMARVTELAATGQALADQHLELALPVSTSNAVRTDDVATITSPLDGNVIVGRLSGLNVQTHAVSRRFLIEVIS